MVESIIVGGFFVVICYAFAIAMPCYSLAKLELHYVPCGIDHSWWKPLYFRHSSIRVVKWSSHSYSCQLRIFGISPWMEIERVHEGNVDHRLQQYRDAVSEYVGNVRSVVSEERLFSRHDEDGIQ
jgi:hypothetical protein